MRSRRRYSLRRAAAGENFGDLGLGRLLDDGAVEVERKHAFADRRRLGRETGVERPKNISMKIRTSASLMPTSSFQIARAKRIPMNLRVKFRHEQLAENGRHCDSDSLALRPFDCTAIES